MPDHPHKINIETTLTVDGKKINLSKNSDCSKLKEIEDLPTEQKIERIHRHLKQIYILLDTIK